jgi:hypothetical protein
MTHVALAQGNPFASFLDPRGVLAACAESPLLRALSSTVHRPLEKPRSAGDGDVTAFDAAIDSGRRVAIPKSAARASAAPVPASAPASAPAHSADQRNNSDILLPGFEWGFRSALAR